MNRPSRPYDSPHIHKLLNYHKSRKDDLAESISMGGGERIVRFAFFKNPKNGKIFYRKFYILDFRMFLHPWQRKALPSIQTFLNRDGVMICTYKVSRRQGKTWLCTFRMLELLLAFSHKNPIGTYFCLLQNQAERNTKEALETHMAKLPGAHFDSKSNSWIVPWPTLRNPRNILTFRIIGGSGRLESKVGGRSDVNGLDEGDGFELEFVDRVAVIPSLDNAGINIIYGTEFSDGEVLDHYSKQSKRMQTIKEAIKAGKWKGDIPKTLNRYYHYEVTAQDAGIYSQQALGELKEMIGDEVYQQDINNINVKAHLRYYYRSHMANPVYEATHFLNPLPPLPHLPSYIYVDVGIGNKSDRMAYCLVQHTHEGMRILWGGDIRNASMELLVTTYDRQCPFRDLVLLEWILPHDAEARSTDLINDVDRLRKWLKNIIGHNHPVIRCLSRPPSKKYALDVGAEYLDKTVFNALYAFPIWEALYHHKRKEVPPKSGNFQDQPAKTKYRDRVDAYLLAARDHSEKTYQGILAGSHLSLHTPHLHPANMGGKKIINTAVPHPTWPGEIVSTPDTLDFSGF